MQTRLKENDQFSAVTIEMPTTGFTSVTIGGVALEKDTNELY